MMGWRIRLVIVVFAMIEFDTLTAFLNISSKVFLPEKQKVPSSKSVEFYALPKEKTTGSNSTNGKQGIFFFRTESAIEKSSKNNERSVKKDKEDGFLKSFWKKNISGKKGEARNGGGGRNNNAKIINNIEKKSKIMDRSLKSVENKIDEIRNKIESRRRDEAETKESQRKLKEKVVIDREKKKQQILEKRRNTMDRKRKKEKDQRNSYEKQMNFFQKVAINSGSNDTKVNGEFKEETDDKNPIQSTPIISKLIRSNNETVKPPKEKSGFNPVSGAQRLISSVWGSTAGSRNQWIVALPKRRIDPGEVVPVNVGGLDLLVIASRDEGKIYCIANSCSHLGTPLETGTFERRKTDRPTDSTDGCEDCMVCPLHQTAFSVETGEVNGPWCPHPPVIGNIMGMVKQKLPIATFDIRIRGKNIEVKINSRVTF